MLLIFHRRVVLGHILMVKLMHPQGKLLTTSEHDFALDGSRIFGYMDSWFM